MARRARSQRERAEPARSHPMETGPARWRSAAWWSSISGIMTAAGTLLAAASLIVAFGAWVKPQPPDDPRPPATPSPSSRYGAARTPWVGYEFFQNNERLPLTPIPEAPDTLPGMSKDIVEVEVGDVPFELRAPALVRARGIKVCAWKDDSIFSLVYPDVNTVQTPFQYGRGLATTAAGDGTLYLNNEGFNYFAEARISRVSDYQIAGYVSSYFIRSESLAVHDSVYLIIFMDQNDNAIMERDEYDFVILRR